MTVSTRALQRHVHATDESHRVTSLELFFDHVFVYGLTQVTALLAAGDQTWHKALGSPGIAPIMITNFVHRLRVDSHSGHRYRDLDGVRVPTG